MHSLNMLRKGGPIVPIKDFAENPNVRIEEVIGLTPKRFEEWVKKASRKELEDVLRQVYRSREV